MAAAPPIDRIFYRLVPNGRCLEFNGAHDSGGYGSIRVTVSPGVYRTKQTHRIVWEEHNGPIPDGLVVRHSCDNPPCCNPDCLLLGTQQDNVNDMIERGRQASRKLEKCQRGHEFTPENTYIYTDKNGLVHRTCRTCPQLRRKRAA